MISPRRGGRIYLIEIGGRHEPPLFPEQPIRAPRALGGAVRLIATRIIRSTLMASIPWRELVRLMNDLSRRLAVAARSEAIADNTRDGRLRGRRAVLPNLGENRAGHII